MVSDAVVEEVRERADLVELFGDYSKLKRTGRTWRGPCPLHGGEGPNFSVDPARGIFKCFVCGEGGDVFAFFMTHLGFDFPSAVRHVAARVGIDVPDDAPARPDPFAHLREVAAFAREWFAERLTDPEGGRSAREYLEKRGLTSEDSERFALGYAPAGWRELRQAALARGIPEAHLLQVGLLAESERSEEPYDRFRDRLMFAICDLRDRPIGFGGRALGAVSDQVPKYINSPESPLFRKSEVLYGLNWARHSIRREDRSLVVEGFLDALALHRTGFQNTVAPLGTALTIGQAEILARYAKSAVLLYDNDKAGLRATFRAADRLLTAGVHPLVVTLPEGEDPDSLIRVRGADGLRSLLGDAVDVLERKIQILERKGYLESIEGRRRALDGLLSTLRAVRDPTLLDLYLELAADRMGVRRETLVHEVAQLSEPVRRPSGPRVPGSDSVSRGVDPVRADPVERMVVLLLVRDPGLRTRAVELELTDRHFRHPAWHGLATRLLDSANDEAPDDWLRELPTEFAEAAEDLLSDTTEIGHAREAFDESVRRMLFRGQIERLDEIDRELSMATDEQARDLLTEKESLARTLREAGVALSFLRRVSRTRTQCVGSEP